MKERIPNPTKDIALTPGQTECLHAAWRQPHKRDSRDAETVIELTKLGLMDMRGLSWAGRERVKDDLTKRRA